MSDEREIADRLLKIAASASESTQEEQNFTSLMAATRKSFRRSNVTPSPRKGRKRKKSFKRKVILMKLAHADFFPSNTELKFLKQRGLGLSEELLEIRRDYSIDEIKENIVLLFLPHIQNLLRMCGFRLGRIDKCKKIILMKDVQNGMDLENQLLQSKLVILPMNDFPDDLPLIEEQNFQSLSQASRITSTQSSTHTQKDSDTENFELEQISYNNSPTTSQSSKTIRCLRSSTRFQEIKESDEEDCDEYEDDQFVLSM